MKTKLKLFFVTLTLWLFLTNMIIYFCSFYYPTELFPYVKPEIHNRCNNTNLQRMKNKQNVFVGHLYHEWSLFFVIKDKIESSFVRK